MFVYKPNGNCMRILLTIKAKLRRTKKNCEAESTDKCSKLLPRDEPLHHGQSACGLVHGHLVACSLHSGERKPDVRGVLRYVPSDLVGQGPRALHTRTSASTGVNSTRSVVRTNMGTYAHTRTTHPFCLDGEAHGRGPRLVLYVGNTLVLVACSVCMRAHRNHSPTVIPMYQCTLHVITHCSCTHR